MHFRIALTIACVALTLTLASFARAQGNDRSSPLGGRSALMGNTGVALGRDGAAPFLNPATVVRIDDRNIAFSANFLSLQVDRFGDWRAPASVDPAFGSLELGHKTISSTRLTALPSTLCLFVFFSELAGRDSPTPAEDPTPWRGGRQKFAICLATMESQSLIAPAYAARASTPAGVTAHTLSLVRTWNRAHVGPTYSAQINDRLSLGVSVHGAYTTTSFVQDATSLTSAADGSATQSSLGFSGNGNSFDLTAVLGATYELGGTTLGASIQVPSLHIFGTYRTALAQRLDAATGSSAILTTGFGSYRAGPPIRFAVGAGGRVNRLTLEADASLTVGAAEAVSTSVHVENTYTASDLLATSTVRETHGVRTRPTVDGALGLEYFTTPALSLLGGLWTNLSTLERLKPVPVPSLANLVQARQSHVGLSFGVGSYGPGGELLFGTQLGYGWGETLIANLYAVPSDWSVVSSRSYSALFVIAGATNFRSIKRAIKGVQNAVTPGPAKEPAPAPAAR